MRKMFAAVLAITVLSACCQNGVVQSLLSPSGKYVATVRKGGCLSNTGFYKFVSVRQANVPVPSGPATCGEPGTDIAGFYMGNNQTVSLHWRSDSLLVASIHGKTDPQGVLPGVTMTCSLDKSVKIVFE